MTIFVLVVYLLVLIFIAIRSFNKIEDFSDFFIARKKGSFVAITGSLIATILGGSAVIGAIDAGSSMGWATSWFMLCASFGLLALIPLAKKINKIGRFTLPELLHDLYGKQTKLIASIIIPIAWIGIIAAQIIAAAKILHSFTGLGYEYGVIISGIVFIGYTIAGGQISILKTDSVQAFLIILGLIVVALFSYHNITLSPNLLLSQSFPFNNNFAPIDLFILVITYSTTFTVGPDIYSRLFCAKNEKTAQKAIMTTAAILIPIALIIGYLSMVGVSLNNPLHGAKIIEISLEVLPQFTVPLIVIALLSAVLSSADTTILSSSIILSDLIERNGFGANSIKKTRYIILIVGIVSILIALQFTSIIEMLLIALTVYSGAFTLPVILGLLAVKIKTNYVSLAILAGSVIAITGKLLTIYGNKEIGNTIIISSMLINGIILLAGHLAYKKSYSNSLNSGQSSASQSS